MQFGGLWAIVGCQLSAVAGNGKDENRLNKIRLQMNGVPEINLLLHINIYILETIFLFNRHFGLHLRFFFIIFLFGWHYSSNTGCSNK